MVPSLDKPRKISKRACGGETGSHLLRGSDRPIVIVEINLVIFVIAHIFSLVEPTLTFDLPALFGPRPTLCGQLPLSTLVYLPVIPFELIDTL